mmetsp:Transcript_97639/g.276745  ORF Transcript_97639/g.276745 Transcript_97639/m.276745 type:complete len:221 (+) Transcript_97639:78-740(+)
MKSILSDIRRLRSTAQRCSSPKSRSLSPPRPGDAPVRAVRNKSRYCAGTAAPAPRRDYAPPEGPVPAFALSFSLSMALRCSMRCSTSCFLLVAAAALDSAAAELLMAGGAPAAGAAALGSTTCRNSSFMSAFPVPLSSSTFHLPSGIRLVAVPTRPFFALLKPVSLTLAPSATSCGIASPPSFGHPLSGAVPSSLSCTFSSPSPARSLWRSAIAGGRIGF